MPTRTEAVPSLKGLHSILPVIFFWMESKLSATCCVPNSLFWSYLQQMFLGKFSLGLVIVPAGSGERLRGGDVAALRLSVYEYITWQSATLLILEDWGDYWFKNQAKKEGLEIISTYSAFLRTFWGCWLIQKWLRLQGFKKESEHLTKSGFSMKPIINLT